MGSKTVKLRQTVDTAASYVVLTIEGSVKRDTHRTMNRVDPLLELPLEIGRQTTSTEAVLTTWNVEDREGRKVFQANATLFF